MRNTTVKTKNRKESKFLGQRRISFLSKRNSRLGLNFIKINQGKIFRKKMESGSLLLKFKSKITGRTAFAYGQNFGAAYQNLIKLFYQKYPA